MNQFLYTLEQYSRTGHLFKQVHRTLPLSIWNYTPEVQYGQFWDEITLQCRGLVTDNEGNVVARPFKKFFNIEEGKHTPTEEFEVFEKMDGSLGILFFYDGKWIIATRGSFISDQSKKAYELLEKYPTENLDKNNTYLFEIIY
jgi:RNA ligase